jgi:hypothetical protein
MSFKGNQHSAGDPPPHARKERTAKVRKKAGGPGVDEKLNRDVRAKREAPEFNVGSGKKCSSCGGTVAAGRKTCQNCGHSFSSLAQRVVELESAIVALASIEFAGNEGNPDALRKWFDDGADGKIDWGQPGDFMACVDEASKHMSDEQAKGFCNERHQDATGAAPGHAPGEDKK